MLVRRGKAVVQRDLAAASGAGAIWGGVCDDFSYGVCRIRKIFPSVFQWQSVGRSSLRRENFLCRLQGDDCDLRGAVETEGQAYCADATVDVELELIEAVVAFGVFLAHGGQNQGTEERQSDLAAVRVAGEHEINEWAARVSDDLIGVVGFVCHEDDGAVRVGGYGETEVGVAGGGIVEAAEPEATAVSFDGEVLVDQNRGVVGRKDFDDLGSIVGDIVIAEAGVAQGSREAGEYFGTAAEGVAGGDERQRAVSDEVAGEQDKVWSEGVHPVDDVFEEEGLCIFVEVDVAELDDAIAVKRSRQVGDGNGPVDDIEFMTSDFAGVKRQSSGGGAGGYQEFSPCEM
jgi:hypothetical protein